MTSINSQNIVGQNSGIFGNPVIQTQYEDLNLIDLLRYRVDISSDREIYVEVKRDSPYFPLFLRLVAEKIPGKYGPQKEYFSRQFYADLDQLEKWMDSGRMIKTEEELGILIAFKNHLLMPFASHITGSISLESIEEQNVYLRRLLTFASKIKKLNPKFQKGAVGRVATNLETQCLSYLAKNYFKSGKYSLAEGTFLKLVHKVSDVSTNRGRDERVFLYECFSTLSKIYLQNKAYDAAARCHQAAIDHFAPDHLAVEGDYQTDLRIFTLIGQAFLKKGSWEKANELFQRSLTASQKFQLGLTEYKSKQEKVLGRGTILGVLLERMVFDEETQQARNITARIITTCEQALTFLESQILSTKRLSEALQAKSKEKEMEKLKESASEAIKKVEISKSAKPNPAVASLKHFTETAGSKERMAPAADAAYESQLSSLIYSNDGGQRKKPKKPKSESNTQEASTSTSTSLIARSDSPEISEKEGFVSRYIENSQTGAKYIFRLNQRHLDAQLADSKLKGRVLAKFNDGEFVSGKGKQGFKYAAHEEKAAKAGYFIKLKLLGEDGLGDFRLYAHAVEGEADENGLKEIIFDGIDFSAHLNKNGILMP